MKVMVDLDEVLYPFVDVFRTWLLSEGHDAPMPAPSCWDFASEWGLTDEGFHAELTRASDAGWLFVHGPPPSGAVGFVHRLRAHGHSIHLATSRRHGDRTATNTERWLNRWKVPFDTLTFAGDKTVLAVDVAVDDSPEHLVALQDAGVRVVAWDRAWNRHVDVPRTDCWDDLYDLLTAADNVKAVGSDVVDNVKVVGSETVVTADTGGAKATKLARFDLIPSRPLWLLAEHYGKGAVKYAPVNGRDNWRNGYRWSLSYAAAMRHANLFWSGEDVDVETGTPHPVAVAWHMFTLTEWMGDERLRVRFDDRQDTPR